MPELTVPWTVITLGLVGLGVLATYAPLGGRTLRRIATTLAILALAAASGPLVELGARGASEITDPWTSGAIDELSALLLPFGALLFSFIAVVRPRATSDARTVRSCFVAELTMLALFLTKDELLIGVLWLASIGALLFGMRGPAQRRVFAVASRYLGVSGLFVVLGVLALRFGARLDARLEGVGVLLVLLAAMVRKGIVPFHGWMPEMFEHGELGSAILFSAPQVAAYTVVRLVVPHATSGMLGILGALSMLTAVYGAGAFVFQRDARRAFGYLFMSQSALVMAGLEGTSKVALIGGLCLWISSGVALAGMGATVWLLEARRGRMSLDRLHGGYENKPLLATSFLVLGLAAVGFPGTLGFVAQDLLVDGAVTEFPRLGFAVILATSLNAIGVLRMFFALFCGDSRGRVPTRLRKRELFAMVVLVALLLGGGLAPQPIVAREARTADRLLAP